MIAVDTNILVHAHRRGDETHQRCARVLKKLAESHEPWAIPWPCIYEFFGVVTNVKIWKDAASSPAEAWAQISAWLASPSLVLLRETDDFADILGALLQKPRIRGGVVHDARIAALCMAHGVQVLLTRDRDFSLFAGLKTRDPLAMQ